MGQNFPESISTGLGEPLPSLPPIDPLARRTRSPFPEEAILGVWQG
ncbi:hypothetical protein NRK67_16775 (plasmid) [Fusobacteria bacterium ZRK30]|nr:hypothetical protein NRK67_16775 [Fusobacteria bacterium ZRK30]